MTRLAGALYSRKICLLRVLLLVIANERTSEETVDVSLARREKRRKEERRRRWTSSSRSWRFMEWSSLSGLVPFGEMASCEKESDLHRRPGSDGGECRPNASVRPSVRG
mmetsp:Transcript_32681/g.104201  ORF Transcript_32681/g.104201 Transcript_32681/m.104201 type:complete len:109 (-) Transcript_32681:655-981(-)